MMTIEELLALREGRKNKVYLDSKGLPTGGIGHLITASEKAKFPVGTQLSDAQISAWFDADTKTAKSTAAAQAAECGIVDEWCKTVLISVNFQLGNFKSKFPDTYAMIKAKKYAEAIKALQGSAWNKQTPVRVKDFTDALSKL